MQEFKFLYLAKNVVANLYITKVYVFHPLIIFFSKCKKRKFVLFIHLLLVQAEACCKQTCTFFELYSQRNVSFVCFCSVMIHLVCWSCCRAFLSLTDVISETQLQLESVFGVLKITLWGKKQSFVHSTSVTDAKVCFSIAPNFKDVLFFSHFLTENLVNQK